MCCNVALAGEVAVRGDDIVGLVLAVHAVVWVDARHLFQKIVLGVVIGEGILLLAKGRDLSCQHLFKQ